MCTFKWLVNCYCEFLFTIFSIIFCVIGWFVYGQGCTMWYLEMFLFKFYIFLWNFLKFKNSHKCVLLMPLTSYYEKRRQYIFIAMQFMRSDVYFYNSIWLDRNCIVNFQVQTGPPLALISRVWILVICSIDTSVFSSQLSCSLAVKCSVTVIKYI